MESTTMGRILVTVKIENLKDVLDVQTGAIAPERVRAVEVTDALVETGASVLSIPKRLIDRLGIGPVRTRQARTSAGPVTLQMYGPVRATIMGRDHPTDVIELPDDCPVLIGQLTLEALDFVIDMPNHRLIGNPAHGGEHILDLY
jgi:predicted aspartyl protease